MIGGEGLDDAKKLAQSMRSEGYGLLYKSRGKSLEISAQKGILCGSFDAMISFLSRLKFASDGVTDMIAFCREAGGFSCARLCFDSMSCDRESMSLRVIAELCDGAGVSALYAELAPLLDKYGLGIIKEE